MSRPDCSIRFVFLGLVFFAAPVAAGALPTITLTVPDNMAAEAGQDPATFTITRSADAGTAALLRVYLERSGTASIGSDYTTTNLTGVGGDTYYTQILAGQTSVTVTLTPERDNIIEGEETVGFTILPPQLAGHDYIIGDPSSGQATISDDVAEVTMTVDDAAGAEAGQDPASFTVTRNGQGNTAAILRVYLERSGTASIGSDYTTTNLTGVGGDTYYTQILGGQTSVTVTLTPERDNIIEGEENLAFSLLAPQLGGNDYTIGAPSMGGATISDDVAEVHLTMNDSEASEAGQDPASFTVTRNGQGNTAAILRVYLERSGTASIGSDYTATNLTGVGGDTYYTQILGGQTSVTVTLTPERDNIIEGEENLAFSLLAPQLGGNDYTIGAPSMGGATISDDVATVTIAAPDDLAAELGQEPATFTITRNSQGNAAALLRVYLDLGGSAVRVTDYSTTNLTGVGGNTYYAQIPAAQNSISVVVTPVVDQAAEGDETVSLTVLGPQLAGNDYLVGMPSQAQITILDNVPGIMDDGFENLVR